MINHVINFMERAFYGGVWYNTIYTIVHKISIINIAEYENFIFVCSVVKTFLKFTFRNNRTKINIIKL